MKTKTGLLALGLFTIAGALTVSCGGTDGDGNTATAGSGATAGTSSGGTSSGGKSSSAGTTNSGAGTANSTGGTNNGGSTNNQGGFNSGAGGDAPNLPDCPASAEDGEPCTPENGSNNACQVDDTTYCICQGQNDPTWLCPDIGDIGAGGAGGGLGGAVTCPANVKNGDTCTGVGFCPGSQTCGCLLGTVICQQ